MAFLLQMGWHIPGPHSYQARVCWRWFVWFCRVRHCNASCWFQQVSQTSSSQFGTALFVFGVTLASHPRFAWPAETQHVVPTQTLPLTFMQTPAVLYYPLARTHYLVAFSMVASWHGTARTGYTLTLVPLLPTNACICALLPVLPNWTGSQTPRIFRTEDGTCCWHHFCSRLPRT